MKSNYNKLEEYVSSKLIELSDHTFSKKDCKYVEGELRVPLREVDFPVRDIDISRLIREFQSIWDEIRYLNLKKELIFYIDIDKLHLNNLKIEKQLKNFHKGCYSSGSGFELTVMSFPFSGRTGKKSVI